MSIGHRISQKFTNLQNFLSSSSLVRKIFSIFNLVSSLRKRYWDDKVQFIASTVSKNDILSSLTTIKSWLWDEIPAFFSSLMQYSYDHIGIPLSTKIREYSHPPLEKADEDSARRKTFYGLFSKPHKIITWVFAIFCFSASLGLAIYATGYVLAALSTWAKIRASLLSFNMEDHTGPVLGAPAKLYFALGLKFFSQMVTPCLLLGVLVFINSIRSKEKKIVPLFEYLFTMSLGTKGDRDSLASFKDHIQHFFTPNLNKVLPELYPQYKKLLDLIDDNRVPGKWKNPLIFLMAPMFSWIFERRSDLQSLMSSVKSGISNINITTHEFQIITNELQALCVFQYNLDRYIFQSEFIKYIPWLRNPLSCLIDVICWLVFIGIVIKYSLFLTIAQIRWVFHQTRVTIIFLAQQTLLCMQSIQDLGSAFIRALSAPVQTGRTYITDPINALTKSICAYIVENSQSPFDWIGFACVSIELSFFVPTLLFWSVSLLAQIIAEIYILIMVIKPFTFAIVIAGGSLGLCAWLGTLGLKSLSSLGVIEKIGILEEYSIAGSEKNRAPSISKNSSISVPLNQETVALNQETLSKIKEDITNTYETCIQENGKMGDQIAPPISQETLENSKEFATHSPILSFLGVRPDSIGGKFIAQTAENIHAGLQARWGS